MPPSSSRSKSSPEAERLVGPFAPAFSVDVEEWFHNCWVPEYNRPDRPPGLPRELDRLLPLLGEELAAYDARATLFVLGELADRHAARLRELAAAGHEIACHGQNHYRVDELPPGDFLRSIRAAKRRLEDLTGRPVLGYRAPEWSLRRPSNPRFALVAEAGFAYDSSLVRAVGAGAAENPVHPTRYRWSAGESLLEVPPLTWAGRLRLPAGGWCGRLAPPRWILAAARKNLASGGLPLLVVHPWEIVDRPCPATFVGLARLFHDAGRVGYGGRLRALLSGTRWRTLASVLEEHSILAAGRAAAAALADTEVGGLDLTPSGATP